MIVKGYAKQVRLAMIGILSTALSGCGGGGSGEEASSEPNPDVPVNVSACSAANIFSLPVSATDRYQSATNSSINSHELKQTLRHDVNFGATSVSVSGSIRIPGGVMVDSDTADSLTTVIPNDSVLTAQAILNPVSVAGYVSSTAGFHASSPGPRLFPQDINDFYSISLKKNQSVSLYSISSANGRSQVLCLLKPDGEDTLVRTTGDRVKRLLIPEDGDYVLQVQARDLASLYQLVVSQNEKSDAKATGADGSASMLSIATTAPASVAIPALSPDVVIESDFVAGEALVKYKTKQVAGARESAAFSSQSNGEPLQDYRPPKLVDLSAEVAKKLATLRSAATSAKQQLQREKAATLSVINTLRKRDDVLYAEPNYLRRSFFEPSDTLYSIQWHYPLIQLPQAWDVIRQSSLADVRVAVIDTGVRRHVDLAEQLVDGYDFVDDDNDPDDPGGASLATVDNFHGTHVAGTIAAIAENTIGGVGVAGVADRNGKRAVKIMPIRVLSGNGVGSDADIIQGMRYAAGLSNRSGTTLPESQHAQVINLSLGGTIDSAAIREAVAQVKAQNIVVVAAAGNDGGPIRNYPAANDGVIAVSAIGQNRQLANYSNFAASNANNWVDVAAPGGDFSRDVDGDGRPDGVLSTWENADYVLLQGTSMATPHVAGVLALIRALNPTITADNIDALLSSGALTTDLGPSGTDRFFGHGLIDASRAVLASSQQDLPPILIVSPSQLNFGNVDTEVTLRVSNAGTQPLEIAGISSDSNWMTVNSVTINGDGTGEYTVQIDREGLDEGVYSGTITVQTKAGERRKVSVIMQVSSQGFAGLDAGLHYVLLITAETRDDVDPDTIQRTVAAEDGIYNFVFGNVAEDKYYLTAGTDLDNDGFVCDDGEFCAEYPVFNEPEIIDANEDLSVSMSTMYLIGFGNASAEDERASGSFVRNDQPIHRGYKRPAEH